MLKTDLFIEKEEQKNLKLETEHSTGNNLFQVIPSYV